MEQLGATNGGKGRQDSPQPADLVLAAGEGLGGSDGYGVAGVDTHWVYVLDGALERDLFPADDAALDKDGPDGARGFLGMPESAEFALIWVLVAACVMGPWGLLLWWLSGALVGI